MSHEHYFRDVSGLERIDVYRLLDLFGVTCPVAQHVVKKAIAAGQRGHKSCLRDWQDIADSAARKLQMMEEDATIIERAADGIDLLALANGDALHSAGQQFVPDGERHDETLHHADVIDRALGIRQEERLDRSAGIPVDLEPAVVANVAAFNSKWQENMLVGNGSEKTLEAAQHKAAMLVVDRPDETRRQDAAAEDEAFAALEARQYTGQGGVMIQCPGCVATSCECRP